MWLGACIGDVFDSEKEGALWKKTSKRTNPPPLVLPEGRSSPERIREASHQISRVESRDVSSMTDIRQPLTLFSWKS